MLLDEHHREQDTVKREENWRVKKVNESTEMHEFCELRLKDQNEIRLKLYRYISG